MGGFDQVSLKPKLDLELPFHDCPEVKMWGPMANMLLIASWSTTSISTYVGTNICWWVKYEVLYIISGYEFRPNIGWFGICGFYMNLFIGKVKTQ